MQQPFLLTCVAAGLVLLSACGGPTYVKIPLEIPAGKTSGLTDAEKAVDSLVSRVVANPAVVAHFHRMFKTVILEIVDFDSLTFTVKIIPAEGGPDGAAHPATAGYSLGSDVSSKPDMVLPLHSRNLENLLAIFADGQVSEEESYRIHRAVFGSNLKSLFQVDALYDPKVSRHLDLPNFIHMTLKNEKGYEFMGSRKEATVTLFNVDGQWLVAQGAQGDPDVKWAVTPAQLAEFQKLVFEPGKGAARSNEAARARLKEVKAFLESITVYRRG